MSILDNTCVDNYPVGYEDEELEYPRRTTVPDALKEYGGSQEVDAHHLHIRGHE